ncbi:hypothetical protein [Lutibacter sp.]
MKSDYKIAIDYNLIVEYHSGTLSEISRFINFRKQLISDPLFLPNQNLIIDLRDVNFEITGDDVTTYTAFASENPILNTEKKVALITATPNQVVSSTLYKMAQKNVLQQIKIFSTLDRALEWLGASNAYEYTHQTLLSFKEE